MRGWHCCNVEVERFGGRKPFSTAPHVPPSGGILSSTRRMSLFSLTSTYDRHISQARTLGSGGAGNEFPACHLVTGRMTSEILKLNMAEAGGSFSEDVGDWTGFWN